MTETDPATTAAVTDSTAPETPASERLDAPQIADDGGIAKLGTRIKCTSDLGFIEFMRQANASVFVTTYQAGKVAILGWTGKSISLTLLDYPKPLGLAVRGNQMVLAGMDRVILFANNPNLAEEYLEDPAKKGQYDALYLARATYFTGPVMAHDVAWVDNEVWFVNTRYSTLASLSQEFSFVNRWKPPFISELMPEDRCHLNGMALVNGKPKYVTALAQTNEAGKWRESKANGGIIMTVPSGEVVMRGLSMPHSLRWYRDKLWFLNSGTGELCVADLQSGKRETVCALQGYTRGLCFAGNYALVGLCMIREKHTFGGLPVQQRHKQLLCGIAIVDIRDGRQVGLCKFTQGVQELYEVQIVAGMRRPVMRMPHEGLSRQAISLPNQSLWARLSKEDAQHAARHAAVAAPVTASESAQDDASAAGPAPG